MLNPMLNDYLAEANRMDRMAEAGKQRSVRSPMTARPGRSLQIGRTRRTRRRYATLQN
jgi:hypothetical protein